MLIFHFYYIKNNYYIKDVKWSLIGAIVWAVLLAVWIVVFQLNRVKWGYKIDSFYVNVPRG